MILFTVCTVVSVVDVDVVPLLANLICLVLSALLTMEVLVSTNDLFVNMSMVALPTKVSGPVGKVTMPLLLIDVIMGNVNVLLDNV